MMTPAVINWVIFTQNCLSAETDNSEQALHKVLHTNKCTNCISYIIIIIIIIGIQL
jgi:type IV secretory pathway VirB2 component (pilin)